MFDGVLFDVLFVGVDLCGECGEFYILSFGGLLFCVLLVLCKGELVLCDGCF